MARKVSPSLLTTRADGNNGFFLSHITKLMITFWPACAVMAKAWMKFGSM